MIRKLAHLCLVTDQLETMKSFYTDQLGLSVQFTFRNVDGETFGYYVACGDTTYVEIFDRVLMRKQWGGGNQPLTTGNRIAHFCFEVTALKDLKATLETQGVKIGEIRTGMDHSLQAWSADPDGNPIEFMEYTHASWQLRGQS